MRKCAIVAAVAALASAELMAVQGTISTKDDTKSGDIKWQPRSKSYAVTFKKGTTDVSAEHPLATVTNLEIPKPAGYDKAVEAVENGQGASAIPMLAKIVADYRMLVWDKPAGRYLALAYLAAGQAPKALEACKSIIADDPTAAYKGALAPAYWEALLKLGKGDQLDDLVKKAMATGDRPSSAAAFIMRGDIVLAAGKGSPDACRKALADGYLRVVLMYKDASCTAERRRALEKAAACLDTLGYASKAEQLRSQAKGL